MIFKVVSKSDYLSSGMVCVRLTEHERELHLPLNLLRDLTLFSVDELIQPPQLNFFYVDGVYSPTGWPADLLSNLQTYMTSNSVTLKPTFQCRNINFARVFVNNVNLAESLVKQGKGCMVKSSKLMEIAEDYFRLRDLNKNAKTGT